MANSPFSFQLHGDRRSYLKFMSWETPRFWVGSLAWCLIINNVYLIAVPEDERDFAGPSEKQTSDTVERGILQKGKPGQKPPDSMK